MSKTAIIVDSTSYLPTKLKEREDIFQADLIAHFDDGTVIQDSNKPEDIEEFFQRMAKEPNLPKTSQPSTGQYLELVEEIVAKGYDQIIAIHLSSGISGTYQTAVAVLSEFQGQLDIHCVDSKGASVIVESQVEYVLGELEKGTAIEEILRGLDYLIENTKIYLMVENLTNLAKGGRLSSTSAVLGNLLRVRPLLFFNEEGKIVMFEKLRTNKRVYARWVELVNESLEKYPQGVELRFAHNSPAAEMEPIVESFRQQFPDLAIYVNTLGPVIATHTGPGTKAIGIIPKQP